MERLVGLQISRPAGISWTVSVVKLLRPDVGITCVVNPSSQFPFSETGFL